MIFTWLGRIWLNVKIKTIDILNSMEQHQFCSSPSYQAAAFRYRPGCGSSTWRPRLWLKNCCLKAIPWSPTRRRCDWDGFLDVGTTNILQHVVLFISIHVEQEWNLSSLHDLRLFFWFDVWSYVFWKKWGAHRPPSARWLVGRRIWMWMWRRSNIPWVPRGPCRRCHRSIQKKTWNNDKFNVDFVKHNL